ncbi:MAG: peptide ABC transporter substrate-binding protein [Erysipelotrichaceae bacterium]|nr:peptide ABC transporter substrate-binding protein [Erysipelotrichaceae bacterium]
MKKLTALLLAVLMGLTVVGCSSKPAETTEATDKPAETETETTTETEYATTFTYAIGGEPDTLDPASGSDSVTAYITNQIYWPLFIIGEDGSMVNAACESYEISEDGMVYTLHLAEGNTWSDGQPCTAADYVYGMKHAINLGSADSVYSTFLLSFVKNAAEYEGKPTAEMTDLGVVAVDDKTIEITLGNPCPYFLSLLPSGVFYPMREEFAKDGDYLWANDAAVPTNGAFHPVKIDAANEIVMEKNTYFPHADEVVVETLIAKTMPDMDAELMAFQTGEIDLATAVNATEVTKIYAGQPELLISDSVINYYVQVNCVSEDVPELQDARVRRALQLAIDRSAIITALDADGVYYELAGYVPNGFKGIKDDFRAEADAEQPYTYTDKEEAKKLLEEAGVTDLKLTYYYNQNAMHDTVAAVLKEQLKDVGVDLTLKTAEIRTFFDDRSNGIFELARGAMSADYMDTFTFLEMGASWYQSTPTWGDATYDELLKKSATQTGDERIQTLHDAEKYVVETASMTIPLFGYKNVCLGKAGIEDAWTSPQANHVLWYVKCPAK